MIKTLSILLLSALAAIGQSTVNWSSGIGQRDVTDPYGQPVTVGTAKIGFFNSGGDWVNYGTTDIRDIFGEPGRFAGVATQSEEAFRWERIYLWIESGDYVGIYTSTAWIFPDPLSLPPENTISINTSQVEQALVGSFDDKHLVLVPEPGLGVLFLIAVAFCFIFILKFKTRC